MFEALQALALFASVLTALAVGVMLLWRYPLWVALSALFLPVFHECFQVGPDALDDVAGTTFYMEDIACVVLLIAGAIVAWRTARLPEKKTWPMVALFSLAAINLARGAAAFGLKPAGNGARTLIYFVVPAVALLLLRPVLRLPPQRLAKWLVGIACVLAVVAVCRWTGAVPIEPKGPCALCGKDVQLADVGRELPRALPAEYAILIGQSLLAIVYLQARRGVNWWRLLGTGTLVALTFALQHRTVWVATSLGLLWLAARTLKWSRRSWVQLAGVTAISLMFIGMLAGSERINRIAAIATENLDETRQQDSTWSWRVAGFVEATDRLLASDASDILLGPPSGTEFGGDASFASVHIHSRYVATLAYYGVFGAMVLIIWLFAVGRRIGASAIYLPGAVPYTYPTDAAFLQALFLSQLVYFVAYAGEMMQGALTALIWLSAGSQLLPAHVIPAEKCERALAAVRNERLYLNWRSKFTPEPWK